MARMGSSAVIAVARAVILAAPWPPPGVPDTAQARALRDQIAAEIAAMPPGIIPDLPS